VTVECVHLLGTACTHRLVYNQFGSGAKCVLIKTDPRVVSCALREPEKRVDWRKR
jgi:hypothetical protein